MKKNNLHSFEDKKENNRRLMLINRLIADWRFLFVLLVVSDAGFYCLFNYIINSFVLLVMQHTVDISLRYFVLPAPVIWGYHRYIVLAYLGLVLFLLIFDLVLLYRIRTSYAEEEVNIGQKGKERWASQEEVRKRYKEIPEKGKEFPGRPGLIVAHYGEKLYIDDSFVNNLGVGITRSGKDEMFVYPTIDVCSRAEVKPSLIVIDPKLESYKSSKKTLERRSYDVYLINIIDPFYSDLINSLTEIVALYKSGDQANAEILANSTSTMVVNPDEVSGKNKYFYEAARDVLTALILAHVDDCIREDEVINEQRFRNFVIKQDRFKMLDDAEKQEVLKELEGIGDDVDLCMDDTIYFIPDDLEFTYLPENEKKITMYSIVNLYTELARKRVDEDGKTTMLDEYFTGRPMMDRAKLKYATIEFGGYETKGNVLSTLQTKLSIFSLENVAKMTSKSSFNLSDIGFGKKPIAVGR